MSQRADRPANVVPLAPPAPASPADARDPLDRSGIAIVTLLERAAGLTDDDCDRAMTLARELSLRLRAAEERAAELQVQVAYFERRATRAESWLTRIHREVEERLIDRGARSAPRPLPV